MTQYALILKSIGALYHLKKLAYKESLQTTMKKLNTLVCDYEAYKPTLNHDYYSAMDKNHVYHESNIKMLVSNAKENHDVHNPFFNWTEHDKKYINSTPDVYYFYNRIGVKKITMHDVINVIDDMIKYNH